MKTMKKSRLSTPVKFLSLILAIVMCLSLFVLPVSAATPKGSVSVNSRYSDNSIKQATLTMNNAWSTDDGGSIRGTLYITFPQGYIYSTPTVDECWNYLTNGATVNQASAYSNYNGWGYGDYTYNGRTYTHVGSNNGDYVRNNGVYTFVGYDRNYDRPQTGLAPTYPSYYGWGYGDYILYNGNTYIYVGANNGDYAYRNGAYIYVGYNPSYNSSNGNNGTTTTAALTAAQQECEARLTDLRTLGETYGWTVDWRPSTVKATDTDCWYLCTPIRYTNDSTYSAFSFSVHTVKNGNVWDTAFKTYQNGVEKTSNTLAEIQQVLVNNGSVNAVPANVYKAANASVAGNSMVSWLQTHGFTVAVSNNSYSSDSGSAALQLTKSGKSGSHTIVMNVAWRDSSSYRCTFSENGAAITLKEVINLFS